jgi:hypothetical protein
MFTGRRLHEIWVRERLSGMHSAKFLTMIFFFLFFKSQTYSLRLGFRRRASPRWSPASSGPPASSHSHVGSSCSVLGQHALGRSLLGPARMGHNWWFVGGSEVFRRLSAVEEIPR